MVETYLRYWWSYFLFYLLSQLSLLLGLVAGSLKYRSWIRLVAAIIGRLLRLQHADWMGTLYNVGLSRVPLQLRIHALSLLQSET